MKEINTDIETKIIETQPENIQSSQLNKIEQRIMGLEAAMVRLEENVKGLSDGLALIPPHVRKLGNKVDDITESVTQPRIRDMLANFLLLHDLVEQMNSAAFDGAEASKNYQVLHDQILQILRVNGIYPIAETDQFDARKHKVVETKICNTPEEDGRIHRIYRTGFETEQNVLRYSEVIVNRFPKILNNL